DAGSAGVLEARAGEIDYLAGSTAEAPGVRTKVGSVSCIAASKAKGLIGCVEAAGSEGLSIGSAACGSVLIASAGQADHLGCGAVEVPGIGAKIGAVCGISSALADGVARGVQSRGPVAAM